MCLRLQWFRYYLKKKRQDKLFIRFIQSALNSKASQFFTKDITAMDGCREISVVAGKNLMLLYRAQRIPFPPKNTVVLGWFPSKRTHKKTTN